jgi:hypothetical protein
MVNLPVAGPMPANPNPNPNAPNPPSGGTAATAGAPASGGSTTLNPGALSPAYFCRVFTRRCD